MFFLFSVAGTASYFTDKLRMIFVLDHLKNILKDRINVALSYCL